MSFSALKDVRILDLTSVVVGPVCTLRLAQYGADVIKLESPEGDLMRGLGGVSPTGQHSGTYLHLNRSKRNISCDLKSAAGLEIVGKLVEWADVIVANMRPRALEKLGLDAQTIRAVNPSKIYCLITGYGTDGPYAGRPTYDSVIQAVSGITGLTMERDGAPAYVPMLICDHIVGEIAAGAILAAIVEWRATGVGSSIEVPMFETMAAFVMQEHLAQHSFDPPVGRAGDRRLLTPNNRPTQTKDGWISFTVNTDKQVRAFLEATGREALAQDARFATVGARAKNNDAWFEVRGAPLTERTTDEWLALFQRADIASQPCHTLEQLVHDPHLAAVRLLGDEDHPVEGRTVAIRPTIRFDEKYAPAGDFAQPMGWATQSILEELGMKPSSAESG